MEKSEKPSIAGQADAEEDDDDLFGPIPTFEMAKKERAEQIKELQTEGSSADHRLAALLGELP